jgi:3-hydroxymyristoyl/3-hydroxydecanoyl-(acyl carrier protein) dehydratase
MQENERIPQKSADQTRQALVDTWMESLNRQVFHTSQAQSHFLETRRTGLSQMAHIIAQQIPDGLPAHMNVRRPILDSRQLDAFGRGSLVECLGPAYAIYAGRRTPRIPNGDLKLVSRVMEIRGEPGNFSQPAHAVTEYDVPLDAWYLTGAGFAAAPYSFLMEMALQPCGILSAWMQSMLQFPEMDFYFRNLDGWAELLASVDLRGKTVTCHADLLSSLSTGDTIIQKFRFELACRGVPFYCGESSFGYFLPQAMAKQLGLDNGRQTRPENGHAFAELDNVRRYIQPESEKSALRLPDDKLRFLDHATVSLHGGRYGQGVVYARKPVNPQDWFYACHFYQDPVMPGSLGIEAILQAIQIYAIEAGLGREMAAPRFNVPRGPRLSWKYRGQITPAHKIMELEAHIASIERLENQIVVQADASLWVDNIRIYEVKQAAVSLLEG